MDPKPKKCGSESGKLFFVPYIIHNCPDLWAKYRIFYVYLLYLYTDPIFCGSGSKNLKVLIRKFENSDPDPHHWFTVKGLSCQSSINHAYGLIFVIFSPDPTNLEKNNSKLKISNPDPQHWFTVKLYFARALTITLMSWILWFFPQTPPI